jgi:hypothetical protein
MARSPGRPLRIRATSAVDERVLLIQLSLENNIVE